MRACTHQSAEKTYLGGAETLADKPLISQSCLHSFHGDVQLKFIGQEQVADSFILLRVRSIHLNYQNINVDLSQVDSLQNLELSPLQQVQVIGGIGASESQQLCVLPSW